MRSFDHGSAGFRRLQVEGWGCGGVDENMDALCRHGLGHGFLEKCLRNGPWGSVQKFGAWVLDSKNLAAWSCSIGPTQS